MAGLPSSQASGTDSFVVLITEKGGEERRETFSSAELSIGRVQGNDIVLPKGNVSKRHARLSVRDGRFFVTDLNSTNGTYVNRRRIVQATVVREGDRIYVGDFILSIDAPQEAGVVGTGPSLSAPSVGKQSVASGLAASLSDPPIVGTEPPREGVLPSGAQEAPLMPSSAEARVGGRSAPERRPLHLAPDASVPRAHLRTLVFHVESQLGLRDGRLPEVDARTLQTMAEEAYSAIRATVDSEAHASPEVVVSAALADLLGEAYVRDGQLPEDCSSIFVLRPDHVVAQLGNERVLLHPGFAGTQSVERAIRRLALRSGQAVTAGELFVERELPRGVRLRSTLAGTGGVTLLLERAPRPRASLSELVQQRFMGRSLATFLSAAVQARANLLLVGPGTAPLARLAGALMSTSSDDEWVGIQSREDALVSTEALRFEVPSDVAGQRRLPGWLVRGDQQLRLTVELVSGGVAAGVVDAVALGATGAVLRAWGAGVPQVLQRLGAEMALTDGSGDAQAGIQRAASSIEVAVEVQLLGDGSPVVSRVFSQVPGREGLHEVLVPGAVVSGGSEGEAWALVATGDFPAVGQRLRQLGLWDDETLFRVGLPRR